MAYIICKYGSGGGGRIPDGKTVTPTDDIKIWLNCADIWDKEYNTLAEVLADSNTLLALTTSNNAVDYMVRSTTWAEVIINPNMTSATTPSGIISGNYPTTGANADWKSFDGNLTTYAYKDSSSDFGYGYLEYTFPNPINISKAEITYGYHTDMTSTVHSEINSVQAYVDGEWVDIATFPYATVSVGSPFTITLSITGFNKKTANYRLKLPTRYTSNYNLYIPDDVANVKFSTDAITTSATAMTYIGQNNYAANTLLADEIWCNAICNSEYFESVLNVKVPVMTSNTTPEGECFAISMQTNTFAYYAFDNNSATRWDPLAEYSFGSLVDYLGYKFTDTKNIVFASVVFNSKSNNNTMNWKIQGSNDNLSWIDISELQSTKFTASQLTSASSIINASQSYQYYRILIDTLYLHSVYFSTIQELQLYGREDV